MVQYTDEDLSRITAIGTDIYKYVRSTVCALGSRRRHR